jgi:hypothetical protein
MKDEAVRNFASEKKKQADQPLFSQKWKNNQRIGYTVFVILSGKLNFKTLKISPNFCNRYFH